MISTIKKIDSITINREPTSDNEVTNKKYVNVTTEEGNILRFIQTLQSYLKESIGRDSYNHTIKDKIQITETKITTFPNTGANL